jgi:ATP-dependent exoDNAse (exonuclease V) alpha subunit
MALKPEFSVMGGLAVGAIVFAIHSQATPSQADIQALPAGTPDIDSAERKATVLSAAVVSGISLIAGDPTIFVMGALMTTAMAVWTRHSNWMESVGGKYLGQAQAAASGTGSAGPEVAETQSYVPFQSEFAR